jgi:hypothetical protein
MPGGELACIMSAIASNFFLGSSSESVGWERQMQLVQLLTVATAAAHIRPWFAVSQKDIISAA